MNRKDFFKRGGRWAILSGFGLLGTLLIFEQKIVLPQNCSVAPLCKNCGKYAQCELPQANKERQHGK